jgi:lambda family phage portal protein
MGWVERFLPGVAAWHAGNRIRLAGRRRVLAQIEAPQQRYDGTGRGRRGSRWRVDDLPPQAEALRSLADLRRRSRDLFKNNAWMAKAVRLVSSEAIGAGIECQLDGKRGSKAGLEQIRRWMGVPTADIAGRASWPAMQALAVRMIVRDGEVLVRRLTLREPVSGLPVRLQLLSGDWLSTDRDGPLADGGEIVNGIEYSARGERVAYHLYRDLPASVWSPAMSSQVDRIPARDVVHLYRLDEVGQERGIPWVAPVMWTLRDLHAYEDAQVVRQIMASSVAMKRTVSGTSADPGEVDAAGVQRPASETFEPGTILRLTQGEDVNFIAPPGVDGYTEVQKASLRKIAAAFGVSYVALTGDYSDHSYSGSRMDHHFMQRMLDEFTWHVLVPHLCEGVLSWLLEAAFLPASQVSVTWTPPQRELLDPSKEIPPMIDAIRGGLISRAESVRRLGSSAEQVDTEQARDLARSDGLGLIYDSDGRQPPAGPRVVPGAGAADSSTDTADGGSSPPSRRGG